MDSEEHAKSSSSPSANRFVRSITEGAGGTQIRIVCTDGSSFYTRPHFFVEHPLSEGDPLSEAFTELLQEETITVAATEKAVQLLARREHSRFELEQKLRKRDFPSPAIRRALDTCEEKNYLDDERFALLWSENRLRRKAEGPRMLAAKLSKKGVSQGIIERVLDQLYTEEALEELIIRAAEKGRRKVGEDGQRLEGYLRARGFTKSNINRYIR